MNRRTSLFLLTTVALSVMFVWHFWNTALRPNSLASGPRFVIESGAQVDSVVKKLDHEGRIQHPHSFRRYLQWRGWTQDGALREGRYVIPPNLDNRTLANLLRSGSREAVAVQFTSVRQPSDLAKSIAPQLSLDSSSLMAAMRDPLLAARHGVTLDGLRTRFIPNTYEVWYDLSAQDFVKKMASEWEKWWTKSRRAKAEKWGLNPTEVGILASIVKAETSKMDEAPTVAGLYLNRLKRGMRLQADPTLIYALGDPSIRRVLNVHRKIDSPYNTYLNSGLPPGPINYPEPGYLEAVLNAEDHSYIFMCAREDFSGYHAFAKTNREHEKNARRYRRALDRQGVYR